MPPVVDEYQATAINAIINDISENRKSTRELLDKVLPGDCVEVILPDKQQADLLPGIIVRGPDEEHGFFTSSTQLVIGILEVIKSIIKQRR